MVIPALDEGSRIEKAVEAIRGPRAAQSAVRKSGALSASAFGDVDVVVVDGGSRDGTVQKASAAGARVIETKRGRARQLEAGWRASRGEVVVFLHADTQLMGGWPGAIRAALADPSVVGGAFHLRFDARGWLFRTLERGAAWRSRWLGLPYGDQGLFVRRRTLEAIGGFRDVPVMEDLDLVWALRSQGRLVFLDLEAVTSARRYLETGPLRTAGRHLLALVLWAVGVDRVRIARWVGR